MKSLIKNTLATFVSLYLSVIPSCVERHQMSPEQPLIQRVERTDSFYFKKAVSVDLGDPADQVALASYCVKNNIPVSCYNFYDFPILEDFSREEINKSASKHTSKLDSLVEGAEIIHFSGHHEVGAHYIFAGSLRDSLYNVRSAINFDGLGIHEEAELVFLTTCFSTNVLSDFTHNLVDKFPNAVFLGYRVRSSGLSGNRKMMEGFLEGIGGCSTKEELAKLWIKTGNDVYAEFPKRDLRALWKEEGTLYEVNRFSSDVEFWNFKRFTQK